MRKTLSAMLLAMILAPALLMAQKQLYFGLAGTGLSSVITNQNNYGLPFEMDYKVTFGGAGNATIGFDFNKSVGLRLEIGVSKLGQNYKDNYKDTVYTRNIKLNYLQLPLMFKFRTGGEIAKFYVMAGPQFNILLAASQQYLKQEVIFDEYYRPVDWSEPILIGKETITERYNALDIMGRVDFGTDIQLTGNLFLNAGLTLAYGFTDINASDYQIPDKDGNYNPSHNFYGGITFGINYLFPVGTR